MRFEGYASTTESPYDMGFYNETIKRGAFRKTLTERPDVVLNIQHGGAASGLPVARTTSGTMQLNEDHLGLHVLADLDDNDPDVKLVSGKMKRGDLDGQMSFAFRVVKERWSSDYSQRDITEVALNQGDVSIVVNGANPTTSSKIHELSAQRNLSLSQRRHMAAVVSQGLAVVECRSFTLDGIRYERGPSTRADASCNRCQGEGEIVLNGQRVACPQCGGDGGTSGNASKGDDGDRARARDDEIRRVLARSAISIARAQLDLEIARGRHLEISGGRHREIRAKYTQKEIDALGAAGKAFKNADGTFSYPVVDVEDLKNAIRAIGRGNASHNKLRLYVIGRARALKQLDLIPDSWDQTTGALKAA